MKINSKYTLSFVVSTMMLSGCFSNLPDNTQTISSTMYPSSTVENSLPSIYTATLLPSITQPPTLDLPPLLTPRVTPFPTITDADASDDVAYMLQTNGDCLFPCFWGILPDQTRYEELYSVIDNLGGSRFEVLQENGHIRISSDFGFGENIGVQTDIQADLQDDIVRDLKVLLLNLYDDEVTPEDWSAYNMNEILRIYGVPSKVELHLSGPNNTLSMAIQLKYEYIYASITYFARTSEINKYDTPIGVLYCPEVVGIDKVELHMGKNPFNTISDGVPVLEATGLTEQDFYKLFTENPSACLTLNRDAMGWGK